MTHELQRMVPPNGELVKAKPQHDLLQIDDVVAFTHFVGRHKWRIMIGTLFGVALAALYYVNTGRIYESKAKLLVVRKSPLTVAEMGGLIPYTDDPMSTHIELIKSPWLVGQAFEDSNLARLKSFADAEDPRMAVIKWLTVTHEKDDHVPRSDSNILAFSLQGPVEEECESVLNAVIQSYQEYLSETRHHDNEDALKLITQKAKDIETDLSQRETEYHAFREETPLLISSGEGNGVSLTHLSDLEFQAVTLNIRRAELEARLTSVRKALQDTDRADVLAGIVPADFQGEAESTLEEKLLPLLLQEKQLMVDFGPGYPSLKAIRDEIDLVRELFSPVDVSGDPTLQLAEENHGLHLANPVEQYIQSLELELAAVRASEQTISQQLELKREEVRKLSNIELRDVRFRKRIARAENLHDNLVNQLQGVDLSKDSGGYSTTVIAEPTAGLQVAPRPLLVFSVATFLGLVLGFGLAGWAHVADKTFREPDAVRVLGVPVLGQIPLYKVHRLRQERHLPRGSALPSMLCTHERPESGEAEAYRGLRTALFFTHQQEQNQVIQVTSPDPGDGKTTLAANLAVSIAQSSKRVLLVDADLRKPDLHRIFGVPADQGLASILSGEAEPGDAIVPTSVAALDLLPAGPRPPNPADLLSSPRLNEFLDMVRERYDFVLVDSPPLLVVSDGHILAAQADGVVLTIRLSKNSRPLVDRATEILRMLDANLLGIVVNGAQCAGYGYASYGANGNGQTGRGRQSQMLATAKTEAAATSA